MNACKRRYMFMYLVGSNCSRIDTYSYTAAVAVGVHLHQQPVLVLVRVLIAIVDMNIRYGMDR